MSVLKIDHCDISSATKTSLGPTFRLSPEILKVLHVSFSMLSKRDLQMTAQVSRCWKSLSVASAITQERDKVKKLATFFVDHLENRLYNEECSELHKIANPKNAWPLSLLGVKSESFKSVTQILIVLTFISESDLIKLREQLQDNNFPEIFKVLIDQTIKEEFLSMKRFATLLVNHIDVTPQNKENILEYIKEQPDAFESLDLPRFRAACIDLIKKILIELSQRPSAETKRLKQQMPKEGTPASFNNIFLLSRMYTGQQNRFNFGLKVTKFVGMRAEYFAD